MGPFRLHLRYGPVLGFDSPVKDDVCFLATFWSFASKSSRFYPDVGEAVSQNCSNVVAHASDPLVGIARKVQNPVLYYSASVLPQIRVLPRSPPPASVPMTLQAFARSMFTRLSYTSWACGTLLESVGRFWKNSSATLAIRRCRILAHHRESVLRRSFPRRWIPASLRGPWQEAFT